MKFGQLVMLTETFNGMQTYDYHTWEVMAGGKKYTVRLKDRKEDEQVKTEIESKIPEPISSIEYVGIKFNHKKYQSDKNKRSAEEEFEYKSDPQGFGGMNTRRGRESYADDRRQARRY